MTITFLGLLLLCALLGGTAATANDNRTTCERIHPEDLPEECSCSEPLGPMSLVIECLKPFNSPLFNDTIGVKLTIDPCNKLGSSISIDITEEDHHIDHTIEEVRAGDEHNYPIPGLSIIVPHIGHVGLDATVWIYGNPDLLVLKVGLNACAVLRNHNVCASSIPGLNTILPWWILSGAYSFGDICNTTAAAAVK